MKNKSDSIVIDYLILSIALTIGVWLFYLNIGLTDVQYMIAKFLAVFYFLWGIIHHYHKGDFHLKIVIEYLVIAVLALIIIRGAIFR